jgi:hypothetical protein
MTMLGHLVSDHHVWESDGYVRDLPTRFGWLRRVLGALFRIH